MSSQSFKNPIFVKQEQTNLAELNKIVLEFLNRSTVNMKILSAPGTAQKTNNYSVVTRIEFKKKSFLIPGDAEGEITETLQDSAVKSTVLLASHHGSGEDKTNSSTWFKKVSPKYIVFSHSDYCGFLHPHFTVVQDALTVVTNTTTTHVLFHQTPNKNRTEQQLNTLPDAYTFAQLNSNYQLTLTNKAVLSTFSQGNISFGITDNENEEMKVAWNKNIREINNSSSDVIEGYLDRTDLAKAVTHLWFGQKSELATKFLKWDIKEEYMPQLRSVDLSYTELNSSDKEKLEQLKQLISKNSNIRELKLIGNDLDDSSQETLKTAWNNRGLDFANPQTSAAA